MSSLIFDSFTILFEGEDFEHVSLTGAGATGVYSSTDVISFDEFKFELIMTRGAGAEDGVKLRILKEFEQLIGALTHRTERSPCDKE